MRAFKWLFVVVATGLMQACVAFPPLIQVEHKHEADSQELIKRLDAIDHRLDQLEKAEKK